MPFVLPPAVTMTLTGATVGFALAKGQAVERILAAVALAIYALPQGVYGQHIGFEISVNALAAPVLVAVALRSDKAWPLAAASIGLVSLATNVAQRFWPVSGWAYGTVCLLWEYLYLAVLAAATWSASRRHTRKDV
jgi:hypothetical protein